MAGAQLAGVVLECTDPKALAAFYSALTGLLVLESDDEWSTVGEQGGKGVKLSFQRSPGYRAPTWPDPASSMQIHLDLYVQEDLDDAEQRAQQLGAKKFDTQPNPKNFRVMADPAGHVFCLCAS